MLSIHQQIGALAPFIYSVTTPKLVKQSIKHWIQKIPIIVLLSPEIVCTILVNIITPDALPDLGHV